MTDHTKVALIVVATGLIMFAAGATFAVWYAVERPWAYSVRF